MSESVSNPVACRHTTAARALLDGAARRGAQLAGDAVDTTVQLAQATRAGIFRAAGAAVDGMDGWHASIFGAVRERLARADAVSQRGVAALAAAATSLARSLRGAAEAAPGASGGGDADAARQPPRAA